MNVKKILVSQPRPSSGKSPYYDVAERHGVEVVFRPFIKVEGLTAREFRQNKVSILDHTAIIFTARTAVDNFFRLCQEMRITVPDTMKYFCTTEAIALYMQKYIAYRKRRIFFGEGRIDALIPQLLKHKKERYLLATSEVFTATARPLDQAGVKYTPAVMYRTVSNDFAPDEPFDYDMLVFFSPQGIESLLKNFPDYKQGDVKIAAFGANTPAAVRAAGLRLDLEAPTPQFPSMPAAIDNFLSQQDA